MSLRTLFFAATEKIDAGDIGITDPVTNANTAVAGILNTVYAWAGIICVIIIVIAGYLYVTANSNAQQIKRAKDAIVGAVIGLVIIMSAFLITTFVIGRF